MKRALLALLVLVAACATAPAAAQNETPIQLGVTHTLQSRILGRDRQINVWTPPNYGESTDRYTVLYVIDGGLDQDFVHIAGLGQLGSLSWTYENLIIVGVRTNARRHELTPRPSDARYLTAFPESGGADDFRRYLAEEVIPFI